MPAIQWWREDYEFRGGELKQVLNNETFKIFEMGKNSALQVSLFLVSIEKVKRKSTPRPHQSKHSNSVVHDLESSQISNVTQFFHLGTCETRR